MADRKRGIGEAFRRRHRLFGHVALYGGRIDPGKGCEELFEYFCTYREGGRRRHARADGREADADPGDAVDPLRRHASRGRAPAGPRRRRRGRGAVAAREPVAARARSDGRWARRCCATPARTCSSSIAVRSNAGLYYADRDEFVEALSLLMADDRLRSAMGRNGRDYVQANYRWDVILGKYDRLVGGLTGGAPASGHRRCR